MRELAEVAARARRTGSAIWPPWVWPLSTRSTSRSRGRAELLGIVRQEDRRRALGPRGEGEVEVGALRPGVVDGCKIQALPAALEEHRPRCAGPARPSRGSGDIIGSPFAEVVVVAHRHDDAVLGAQGADDLGDVVVELGAARDHVARDDGEIGAERVGGARPAQAPASSASARRCAGPRAARCGSRRRRGSRPTTRHLDAARCRKHAAPSRCTPYAPRREARRRSPEKRRRAGATSGIAADERRRRARRGATTAEGIEREDRRAPVHEVGDVDEAEHGVVRGAWSADAERADEQADAVHETTRREPGAPR